MRQSTLTNSSLCGVLNKKKSTGMKLCTNVFSAKFHKFLHSGILRYGCKSIKQNFRKVYVFSFFTLFYGKSGTKQEEFTHPIIF